ncbi:MAG TPA: O-antigen ligase family protein [Thermoanaerobaculia bacterium]|nr:O-antigen ligase family protein [Thermoanaerobaculia bacterium]
MAPLFEPSESRPERAGYWLYVSHLATIFSIAASSILLGLTILSLPWTRRRADVDWAGLSPLLVPLGFYVLLLTGSVAASYDPRTSVRALTEIFSLTTLVLAPLLVRGERQVRLLVDVLIGGAALLACAGLSQYLVGYGDIDRRIRGPFSHYMTFSGFLLVCDLLLVASMVFAGRWRSVWRWGALAAINVALLGSYTRNAWVAFGVALTVLVVLRAPRLLLAYVPATVLFIALAPVPLLHRVLSITDLRDASNYDRLCMLEAGLTMVRERPLFGFGPELVERRYPIYRSPSAPRYDIPHLHNSLLEIAAERGLPALGAYLWLTAAAILEAWRRFRREGGRRGPRADLYVGVMLALLAFNVAGLFENNWGDTEVQRSVLFVLALPFCLAAASSRRPLTGMTVARSRGEDLPSAP